MVRITGFYVTCIARASDVYYEGVNFVDMIKFRELTYPTPITCSLLIFLQKEWSGKMSGQLISGDNMLVLFWLVLLSHNI